MTNFLCTARGISTALLLVCVVLPLSRCEKAKVVRGPDGSIALEEQETPEFQTYYAFDYFEPRDISGYLALLTFTWPLAIAVVRKRTRTMRSGHMVSILEIVLCLAAAYMVWAMSSLGERLFGAYVALAALALYLVSPAKEVYAWIWRKSSPDRKGEDLGKPVQ